MALQLPLPMALATAAATLQAHDINICRNIPGDAGWPSPVEWSRLNKTLSGRLIETVPQASVCHLEPYNVLNEAACQALRSAWDSPPIFVSKPAEMLNPAVQNQSCDPFTPTDKYCDLGNYVNYSINVTGANDVVAGIKFAKKNNVRLVIKNTGHDFMGRSTGKGGLAFWTHSMNSIEVLDNYTSPSYKGPAAKLGSGVMGGGLYAAVAARGYRAVGGTCGSVGIAGGYTAGGGHSLLNGLYGMAADNVLEWEVVTADGKHITATPTNKYSDLYWAMSGGGGGVWGVALSMTVKIFPDGSVGGGRLFFNTTNIHPDAYWKAIEEWFAFLPSYTDGLSGGNTAVYDISATRFSGLSFTVPGGDASAVDTLLQPYLDKLATLHIPYTYTSHSSDTYYTHFGRDFGPLPFGPFRGTALSTNRLVPRRVVQKPRSTAALVSVIRDLTSSMGGGIFSFGCESLRVNRTNVPENAVLAVWDDTIATCATVSYWDWGISREEMLERKTYLTEVIVPALEGVTPGSGSYMNEVDGWYRGDWKRQFYGVNWERLGRIKRKYDPEGLFYTYTGVGSERWVVDREGRLCRS